MAALIFCLWKTLENIFFFKLLSYLEKFPDAFQP